MRNTMRPSATGICTITPVVDGKESTEDIYSLISDEGMKVLKSKGDTPMPRQVKKNLVVNSGRGMLAKLLGGAATGNFIDRLILGDMNGDSKLEYAPNLADENLRGLLTDFNGSQLGGIYLDPLTDKHYPGAMMKFPSDPNVAWGSQADISIDPITGETILTDNTLGSTLNFSTLNIESFDQVKVDSSPTNPAVMGIKSVKSTTELSLHNPGSFIGTDVFYRIDRPESMLLVSKLVRGNDFPVGQWGPITIVKEAGLLFGSGDLFNRVVIAPGRDDAGMILQPSSSGGPELSLRFEWVVVF